MLTSQIKQKSLQTLQKQQKCINVKQKNKQRSKLPHIFSYNFHDQQLYFQKFFYKDYLNNRQGKRFPWMKSRESLISRSLILPDRGQEDQQQLILIKTKLEQQFLKDHRPLIAVDLDEVLSQFLLRLNDYYNKKAKKKHKFSDYYRYIYADIWKVDRKQAADIVHSFYQTQEFKEKIPIIPYSQFYINKLKEKVNLVIVTSRQNVIQYQTVDWLNRYFYTVFQEVYFGNSHSLNGKEQTKYNICKEIGADLLIDDNPKYCEECSDNGMKSILFNYNNQYPWSQLKHQYQTRDNITKLTQWKQVYNKLKEIYKF